MYIVEVALASYKRVVFIEQWFDVDVEQCRRSIGLLDLDALDLDRAALTGDAVERRPEVDRPVRELEIFQGSTEVGRRDLKQHACELVGRDQGTLRVDHDLRERRPLGHELADPKLPGDVVV